MRISTNDRIEGKVHEVKGTIKETVGHLVGNPSLEAEGKAEALAGKVQTKVGQVEKVFEK
jgi:uncharacterized protein YjbJ (UPF0337 family)